MQRKRIITPGGAVIEVEKNQMDSIPYNVWAGGVPAHVAGRVNPVTWMEFIAALSAVQEAQPGCCLCLCAGEDAVRASTWAWRRSFGSTRARWARRP